MFLINFISFFLPLFLSLSINHFLPYLFSSVARWKLRRNIENSSTASLPQWMSNTSHESFLKETQLWSISQFIFSPRNVILINSRNTQFQICFKKITSSLRSLIRKVDRCVVILTSGNCYFICFTFIFISANQLSHQHVRSITRKKYAV